MRVALILEYDGSEYHGWQAQSGLHTVQHVVEHALSRVANEPVSVVCAGRTDTGVHALMQVVHFDCQYVRNIRAWIYGTNTYLPKDICVKWAKEMPDTFHARYTAVSRRYRYVICNTSVRPALFRRQVAWQYRPLNHQLMHEAGQYLVGEHDFTSFRSIECQSPSAHRTIYELVVKRQGDQVIIEIEANAFLHHMVRNIAGMLMAVGSERAPIESINQVLEARDRRQGAETAPAYGLYLMVVRYPKIFEVYVETVVPWI